MNGQIRTDTYASAPSCVRSTDGIIWTAWRQWDPKTGLEKTCTAVVDTHNSETQKRPAYEAGTACGPPVLGLDAGGGVYAAWAQMLNRSYRIMIARPGSRDQNQPVCISETGDQPGPVSLAVNSDGVVVVFSKRRSAGRFVGACTVDAGLKPHQLPDLTPEMGIHDRPGVVYLDGENWLIWQAASASRLLILARKFDASGQGPIVQLSGSPAAAPSCCVDSDKGIWAAWHSPVSTDHDALYRFPHIARVEEERVLVPEHENACEQPDRTAEDAGLECPRILCHPDGHLTLIGRSSQGYHYQELGSDGWTQTVRIGEAGWSCRGHTLGACTLDDGKVFFIRREKDGLVWDVLEPLGARGRCGLKKSPPSGPRAVDACTSAPGSQRSLRIIRGDLGGSGIADSGAPVDFIKHEKDRNPVEEFLKDQNLHLLWGDMHSHSVHSDGTGLAAEWYFRARYHYGLDVFALSDHESFLGKKTGPGEWDYLLRTADDWNEPGRFVTLYAFEYTGDRDPGPGHKVVYPPEDKPVLLSRDEYGRSDSGRLLKAVRRSGAIAVPHHTGWTGADMKNHSPEVQPVWEICSCHGAYEYRGNMPVGYRKELDAGHFARDALDRGLRFGFTAGSDGHGLEWHHGVCRKRDSHNSGLTGIFATSAVRGAVMDAIRRRRCFATTGAKIALWFSADGRPMGEEINTSSPVEAVVRVKGTGAIKQAVIVSNEGVQIELEKKGDIVNTKLILQPPEHGSWRYYYVRVVQKDSEMAWSSPIWLDSPLMA